MLRRAFVFSAFALLLLAPRPALAITVDQVLALQRAGVTDTVILALIDRDRTVFAIEPEQIVSLQRGGLSEKIILAMLKSGRDEGDQAARVDAANNAAWIASNLATEPISISVGHGPDRPNTPHIDGFYSGPPAAAAGFFAPSYYGPAFRSRRSPLGSRRSSEASAIEPRFGDPRALCYANVSTQYARQQGQFVTECPAIMQPRRR